MTKKYKILITGAAGFLGSHLSEKLTDIWHMTNSPVRLGDARATWSHENTTPTKDKRPSIVKVRENHEWIDRRVQMIEELEKGNGKEDE